MAPTPKKRRPADRGRVPLTRALSKLGHASRTEAEALIRSGQVKVHGSVETDPGRLVNPDTAHIEVAEQKVRKGEWRVVLFHKPKGVLTTKRDPEGRPTIYDHLPAELHSLHAVGRLDQHTTGLLLLTNDTRFSSQMTDPEQGIPRVYIVGVRGEFTAADAARALGGIDDAGERLQADGLEILKASARESKLRMTLSEGKNREIRRICLSLGHEVISLKRISYGPFELGELKPGEHQILDIAGDFKPDKMK